MGRKKLEIKRIGNDKIRCITYSKRKVGLLKKAAQLAVLCQAKVRVQLQDEFGNVAEFRSDPSAEKPREKVSFHPLFTIEHYPKFDNPVIISTCPQGSETTTDRPAENTKESDDLKITTEPEIQPSEEFAPTWFFIPGTQLGCLFYPTSQTSQPSPTE